MFLKYLKLLNGDDIIVTTDDQCLSFKDKEFIEVIDPVLINLARFSNGDTIVEAVTMQSWLKGAKRDVFRIPISSIIIATDVEDRAVEQYNKFVSSLNSDESFSEQGEEEINIEELMQSLLNDDSEENDNDGTRVRTSRTFH